MQFFLDTNVFYGDWFVRSANFRYLFHFLNNEGHDLLLSRLVLQEAENIRNRELAAAIAEAKRSLLAAEKSNGTPVFAPLPEFRTDPYDLLSILQEKVESVVVVEYEDIPQSLVVGRALQKRRPFQESEKGYRDTLIWLSLLNYIRNDSLDSKLAFVSANKADFFDSTSKTPVFHPDLLEDLKQACPEKTVDVYSSLFDFVDKTVDKSSHAIDFTKAESTFGEYLEEQGVAFLESVQPYVLGKLQEVLTPGVTALANTASIHVEITEGLEDLTVHSASEIGASDVYISCTFDMRRVQITTRIPESDYLIYRSHIEGRQRFYERDTDGDSVLLTTTIRPYFTASFVHNVVDQSNKNFTIDDFSVR